MSFLKITDPNKRDQLVQELLNTRRAIKEESYSNHLGKIRIQDKYSKQLKPVTDKLDVIPKAITSSLEPTLSSIPTALAALPSSISDAIWPQILPAATGTTPVTSRFTTPQTAPDPLQIEDISTPELSLKVPQSSILFGDIAGKYMNSVMTGQNTTDTVFGIHTKEGQQPGTFYIGTKPVLIAGNDLIINDKKYEGTEGIWNLIMNREIEVESFTDDDWGNYKDIPSTTKALQKNDPTRPKSNKSDKWKSILSHIWEEINPKKSKKGNGLAKKPAKCNIIFLPRNPNALFDRL
jgi:hypothetical protein